MHLKTTLTASLLLAAMVIAAPAYGQECGPGCPACSGKATGDLLAPGTLLASGLFIPDGEEETIVTKLGYGVVSWLDVGIGYAIDTEEVIWSARVQPIAQDRDGWQRGQPGSWSQFPVSESAQSVYAQLAKSVEIVEGRLGLSVAGGYATDLPDLEESWGLASAALTLFDRVSPFYSYDGVNSHAGLSYFATDWLTVTAYALEMEEPAVQVSVLWGPGEEEDEHGDEHDEHGHEH